MPASAKIFTATQATLAAAFNIAAGGDMIKLLGNFDSAYLANRSFNGVVTLDSSQAVFSGTITFDNVSQVALNGGTFNIAANGAYAKGIAIYGGFNIYFDNVTINGSANGLVDQFGIAANGTHNLQVTHSKFNGLYSGIAAGALTGGFLAANTFVGSTSDGIDISDSHGTTAAGNKCSGGHPGPGAHPDCIQLWSVAGHALESDITVTGNSAYGPTQGFTDFDAGLRIKFTKNTVESSYIAGVACYDCIDSIITNNVLSTLAGAPYQTQIVIRNGSGNTILGNSIAPYIAPSAATSPENNPVVDLFSQTAFSDTPLSTYTDGAVSLTEDIPAAIPEPSSWALLVAGFGVIGLVRRRVRRTMLSGT